MGGGQQAGTGRVPNRPGHTRGPPLEPPTHPMDREQEEVQLLSVLHEAGVVPLTDSTKGVGCNKHEAVWDVFGASLWNLSSVSPSWRLLPDETQVHPGEAGIMRLTAKG